VSEAESYGMKTEFTKKNCGKLRAPSHTCTHDIKHESCNLEMERFDAKSGMISVIEMPRFDRPDFLQTNPLTPRNAYAINVAYLAKNLGNHMNLRD
jgi:hypothetical protein